MTNIVTIPRASQPLLAQHSKEKSYCQPEPENATSCLSFAAVQHKRQTNQQRRPTWQVGAYIQGGFPLPLQLLWHRRIPSADMFTGEKGAKIYLDTTSFCRSRVTLNGNITKDPIKSRKRFFELPQVSPSHNNLQMIC